MTASRSIFAINLRHGIWSVTLDGAFFGDCKSKALALAMAEEAAASLRSDRHIVTVVDAGISHLN